MPLARLFALLALFCSTAQAADIVNIPSAETPSITAGEGEAEPEEAAPAEPAKTPSKPAPAESTKSFNAVRLQGLDKVTARVSTITAPLGVVTRFENLEIIARKCWQAPPEDRPENAALLEIRELKPGEGPEGIFSGWMFASSPALSALEHPVYDITVLECTHLDKQE